MSGQTSGKMFGTWSIISWSTPPI